MAIPFSELTRPAIRALKAGKSLTEHGITFRRDAIGDGVFSINTMVDRRRIHLPNPNPNPNRCKAQPFGHARRTKDAIGV